jgi:hypothetical protein
VRGLGLDGYTNTSYTRALAALIDDDPERYAVIDAGTNSIKFHIGERDRDGCWRTLLDRAELTRLGEGLAQQGLIGDAALERTADAIAGMVREARQHQVRAIAAVGTAGLRIARNGDAVVAAIQTRTGVRIEVISGEEESRLAYLAAKAGLDSRRARSSCSTLAAAARSSPSGTGTGWTSASASMSVPHAIRSATGSTAPCPSTPYMRPWQRFRPTSPASRGARPRMSSSRWEAP